MKEITCFKAYDVRGRVPDQLNEDIARRIGRAYAEVIKPRQVVVGHDIRLSSEAIKAALVQGLLEQGVDVYDIGLCGTEEIYFATSHAGHGRRYCDHRQPQPERLQRHEIRARGVAADLRRYRPVRHQGAGRAR